MAARPACLAAASQSLPGCAGTDVLVTPWLTARSDPKCWTHNSPEMSGLDQVASVVRAVRLGALALILIVAVGGSWAAMQPGRGHAAAPARSAGINHGPAQVQTMPYFVIVAANGKPVNPACVTPVAVDGGNTNIQYWLAIPNPKCSFRDAQGRDGCAATPC